MTKKKSDFLLQQGDKGKSMGKAYRFQEGSNKTGERCQFRSTFLSLTIEKAMTMSYYEL